MTGGRVGGASALVTALDADDGRERDRLVYAAQATRDALAAQAATARRLAETAAEDRRALARPLADGRDYPPALGRVRDDLGRGVDRLAALASRAQALADALADGHTAGAYLRATSAAHERGEAWQAYALGRVAEVAAEARTLGESAEAVLCDASALAAEYLGETSGEDDGETLYAVAQVAARRWRVHLHGLADAEAEAAEALARLAVPLALDALGALGVGDRAARGRAARAALLAQAGGGYE